ncbi:sensor histidine kinase [Paenibacillus sp. D51F]
MNGFFGLPAGFRPFTLERKLYLLTSIVIFLAVPITGTFSYYQASRILEDYAYNAADQTVTQLSGYMNNELKNVSDKLYVMNASESMKRVMDWSQNKSDVSYAVLFNEMFSLFSRMRVNSSSIRTIYMYTPKGEFYEGIPYEKKNVSFLETPYYEAIRSSPTNKWVYSREDPMFEGTGDVITLVTRPVGDFSGQDENAYLAITLTAEKYVKNLQSIKLVPSGFSMIVDRSGQPVLASSSTPVMQSFLNAVPLDRIREQPSRFDAKVDNASLLVNHRSIPFTGWEAVVVQPKDRLFEKISYIKYFTVILTAILLVTSFLLNRWFVRLITRPLRKLMKLMNRVKQGDLNVRFSSSSQDEIGVLGSRFDDMLHQIQQLLHQVVEETEAKQRAEMRALQAQINPHFLYNTLDELYWKLLEVEDKSASEMILSLSRFFRLSLNKGEEMTTLAKEFEHAEQYLKLVHYQYQKQFSYEVALDPRLTECTVPKIIIQPLVENSILHAFQRNEYKDSFIKVAGEWRHPDTAVLRVEDNGSGMSADLLERINRLDDSGSGEPVSDGGYAIRNIKERLKTCYGDRAEFRMKSANSAGTVIEIIIPINPIDGKEEWT